jgi:hypothetical protein
VILEDFVMLGTTVPEPNKTDGRVFVCSAGVSAEVRRLIRIYPLARRNAPRRWGMYKVAIERNPRDSREESFAVQADRRPGAHEWINHEFEQVQAKIPEGSRSSLLSRYVVDSIQEANSKRLSLAIVQPDVMEIAFDGNPASAEEPELVLFDTGEEVQESVAQRFALMPRIRFRDEGGWHNLMLRDWGAFELQRKQGAEYFRNNLAGALHLRPSSSLLVGNMRDQRTAWLVISVLNGIRNDAPTLFDG